MDLQTAADKIRQKIAHAPHIKARVKFDFGDDGLIFIDSTQEPPVLSHEDGDSDVTLSCSLDTFAALLEGRQDPNIAFMMGKLKVQGSMGLAMKLNGILEE